MRLRLIAIIFWGAASQLGTSHPAFSQDPNTIELQTLIEEVSQITTRLEELELRAFDSQILEDIESSRNELQKLHDGLNAIGRQVSLGQMFLSGQFFAIFASMIAVAGLIAGFVTDVMIKGTNALIRRSVRDRVSSEVMSEIENSSHYVIAKTHGQQAFAWWDHYHDQFQKFLRKEEHEPLIVRDIRLSKDIAAKGLNELSKLTGSIKSEAKTVKLESDLRNHWVYNRTAEALLQIGAGDALDDSERNRLISEADKCMKNSKLKEAEDNWYNYIETAQFCLLKFGSEAEKREARALILALFEYESGRYRRVEPKPRESFLRLAYDCYFPVSPSTGERFDLHSLGRVPAKP